MGDDLGLTDLDIAHELVERYGLRGYVEAFWRYAEPAVPFVGNWHVDALCEHLEAVQSREIGDLVINMPPRQGKSLIVSVQWPGYVWGCDPKHRFICASYDLGLVLRDAGRMIDVCESPEYRRLFPATGIHYNSPRGNITTDQHGRRLSTTPAGKGTGWGANTIIVDDPTKPKDAGAKLPTALENVKAWWNGTMANRRDGDPKMFRRVVIMQRLAEEDLAGVCLEQGYEHLMLPMRYVPNAVWDRGSSLGKCDPRTEPGEMLFPKVWDREVVDKLEAEMSPSDIDAQNQQNPKPRGGQYCQPEWLEHTWDCFEVDEQFFTIRQYWDFNAKGWVDSSHSQVAGILVAALRGRVKLLDWTVGHWDYPTARSRFVEIQSSDMWRKAGKIWIEDKANGTPLLADLKSMPEIRSLSARCAPWNPGPLSKQERFMLESPKLEAGLLMFPEVRDCAEVKRQLLRFPKEPNDLVDCVTMALADLATPADVADQWRRARANLDKLTASLG